MRIKQLSTAELGGGTFRGGGDRPSLPIQSLPYPCMYLVLKVILLSPVGLFHRGDLHLKVVPLLVVYVAQLY